MPPKKQSVNDLICRIVLQHQIVDEKDLNGALKLQRQLLDTGKDESLENVLLEQKLIRPSQLKSLRYAILYYYVRKADRFYGKIAIQSDIAEPEWIEDALKQQKKLHTKKHKLVRLSRILRDRNLINEREDAAIWQAIKEIRAKRKAAKLARRKKGKPVSDDSDEPLRPEVDFDSAPGSGRFALKDSDEGSGSDIDEIDEIEEIVSGEDIDLEGSEPIELDDDEESSDAVEGADSDSDEDDDEIEAVDSAASGSEVEEIEEIEDSAAASASASASEVEEIEELASESEEAPAKAAASGSEIEEIEDLDSDADDDDDDGSDDEAEALDSADDIDEDDGSDEGSEEELEEVESESEEAPARRRPLGKKVPRKLSLKRDESDD